MNTNDAVQQLLDLEAIRTLKHRYIRCMTQSRWDELETLLAPDIDASYSDGKYVFCDRASLMEFLRRQDPAGVPQLSYWHVTMPEITFHGPDRASGIWAMYHFHLRKNEQQQLEMFAYYNDEYRKVGQRWLIARTGYQRVMEQSLDRGTLPGLQLLAG
ncbi:MAG: nuclear transport factor 2 family protein [Pseudomonadales bacterium]|mgnify:FL=1|jgi:hypothetical protein|nr:nuclear transport factor 2 family protein [Pseudomonadales bacterium]MBP9034178.1 nuclear transport factor 2 family protein [Pseudomonadales bacterium]